MAATASTRAQSENDRESGVEAPAVLGGRTRHSAGRSQAPGNEGVNGANPSGPGSDAEGAGAGRVLLTGATGYVGGRLLRTLEESGRPVRCMVRRPEVLSGRAAEQTEIVHGDILDPDSLHDALAGVTTAYYLVHSMAASGPVAV